MDILTQLDRLAALQDEREALLHAQRVALPTYLKVRLEAIEKRFAPQLAALTARLLHVEHEVKTAVIAHGASVKGARLHAVYVPGKAHWDSDMLAGYAVTAPEILLCCSIGAPSVALRKVKEGTP